MLRYLNYPIEQKFQKKEEIKLVENSPLCSHVLQNCIRPLLIDYFLIAGSLNQLGSRANHVMLKKALSDEFETEYLYIWTVSSWLLLDSVYI